MLLAKSMKKMLRQMFFVFEAEQCLEMKNYKYSFHQNFIIFWHMKLDQHRVDGKKSNFLKLKFWPKKCNRKIIQALASSTLERKVCF